MNLLTTDIKKTWEIPTIVEISKSEILMPKGGATADGQGTAKS